MRPATPRSNHLMNDQPLAFQTPEPLPNSRRRHANCVADLLNRPSTHTVKLLKKVLIIWIDRDSHVNNAKTRARTENRQSFKTGVMVEPGLIFHNQN